ncbi:hypothetical protein ACH5RR_023562 [Cinchona calisaya]|uniref:Uncharacterized protein n=1 Tax=Cinchona calisaya TaxID=153742 RepID=A0ABD2ZEG6_9GENT
MMYLGYPLKKKYILKRRALFQPLIEKILAELTSWHSKLLAVEGKLVLIKHVLSSITLYLLAALQPPNLVLDQIDRILSNFFWGKDGEYPQRHWIAWKRICQPEECNGLGISAMAALSFVPIACS